VTASSEQKTATRPLNRSTYDAGSPAPVRIVHIGLGAFHRAHQAWYTDQADAGREWGIAAFTGRSPKAAEELNSQDGLYTLIERTGEGDNFSVLRSIVEAYDGADLASLSRLVAAPATAIVTMTVTEAAYYLGVDGRLDLASPVVAKDIALLRAAWAEGMTTEPGREVPATESGDGSLAPLSADTAGAPAGDAGRERPASMAARLVVGLDARRRAQAGPIAVVSCDNLAANGTAARHAVLGTAAEVDEALAAWIDANVSFVDTSIDRITPRTTEADMADVAEATGYADVSPVVTEPFRSWVLSGDFPAGRPRWEDAGAVFVDEIEHFERRKLWLLNGAHSLMAYSGQLRGHETVAQALADPACAGWVEDFWNEAAAHLTEPELDVPGYRSALLERFANPRIAHYLAQIAMDGSSKLRMRAVPVLKAERAAGRTGAGAARMIAAWLGFLAEAARKGEQIRDAEAARIGDALALQGRDRTVALVGLLDAELAAEASVLELIEGFGGTFS
jgi:fructuronate reductase